MVQDKEINEALEKLRLNIANSMFSEGQDITNGLKIAWEHVSEAFKVPGHSAKPLKHGLEKAEEMSKPPWPMISGLVNFVWEEYINLYHDDGANSRCSYYNNLNEDQCDCDNMQRKREMREFLVKNNLIKSIAWENIGETELVNEILEAQKVDGFPVL